MVAMPTLTIITTPVSARVIIFRIAGRYGVMNQGLSPLSASREQPWTWLIDLSPVVDREGFLWVPERWQYQGLITKDSTVTVNYIKAGHV